MRHTKTQSNEYQAINLGTKTNEILAVQLPAELLLLPGVGGRLLPLLLLLQHLVLALLGVALEHQE